jgi:hypothetical protein
VKLTKIPRVTLQALSSPAVNVGTRQLVRVSATGWGRLCIRNSMMQYTDYFFEDSEWEFIVPKNLSTEVTAANFFGRSATVLTEKPIKTFLPQEKIFEKLKLVLRKTIKPSIKALPRISFDIARISSRGQFEPSHQILEHRIRMSNLIRLPSVQFRTRLKFFKIPTVSVQNRIKPSYKNVAPAFIIKDALDIKNVIQTIKKEIEHEHR